MEWKVIKGYPDYMVSDEGQVYSMKSNKVLSIAELNNGYKTVGLCTSGKPRTFLVHRLVYETFVDSIPKGYEVNHKDENKRNNRLDNLELLTHKQNVNFGSRNARARQSSMRWYKTRRRTRGRAVLQFTLDGVLIKKWDSMAEADDNGFNSSNIYKCCRGILNTHKGYRWEYADMPC